MSEKPKKVWSEKAKSFALELQTLLAKYGATIDTELGDRAVVIFLTDDPNVYYGGNLSGDCAEKLEVWQ